MLQFTVNDSLCTRCRQCVLDCPSRIIEQKGKGLPCIAEEREGACLRCQHCLAVCPTGAISILGFDPDKSLPLGPESFPDLEQMSLLIRGRRSVRQYRDANVDPALLQQLLATLAHAPTGVNNRSLTFTVIDDKEVMQEFQRRVMAALAQAAAENRIPARYAYLVSATTWKYEYGVKLLFRNAPHALLISAPPDSPCPGQDIPLALAYFDLLASSAGLGTVWWGMLNMVLETVPELKSFLGLPTDHQYFAMLFGLPAVHYARTVQRDTSTCIRRVSL